MAIFNKFNTSYFFAFDNKTIEKVNFPKFLYKALKYMSRTFYCLFLHCLLLLLLQFLCYLFIRTITLVNVYLNWLNWFHFLILEGGLLVILIDCMIFLSPLLDVTRMYMSRISLFAQADYGFLCLQMLSFHLWSKWL